MQGGLTSRFFRYRCFGSKPKQSDRESLDQERSTRMSVRSVLERPESWHAFPDSLWENQCCINRFFFFFTLPGGVRDAELNFAMRRQNRAQNQGQGHITVANPWNDSSKESELRTFRYSLTQVRALPRIVLLIWINKQGQISN